MDKKSLYLLIGLLSLAGYAWIVWHLTGLDSISPVQPVCLFKSFTHVPCPSCGTTRAILLLLAGDMKGSLNSNPLGILSVCALIVLPLWILIDIVRKKDSLRRGYIAAEGLVRRKPWLSLSLVFLFVANWIWNIAKSR